MITFGRILCFLKFHDWFPDPERKKENGLFTNFVPYVVCKRCGKHALIDYHTYDYEEY